MSYSSEFIASDDSARKLLLESGYSSDAAINAVTLIGELCIYAQLIRELSSSHIRGESIVPYFETEISAKPMHLRGSITIDLIHTLEEGNVIVPRGKKYRVMLSNLMNRIFTITAHDEKGSIRHELDKLRTSELFIDVLDTIEYEIVSALHENIDLKYLDIPLLKESIVPTELHGALSKAKEIAANLLVTGIDLNEPVANVLNAVGGSKSKEKATLIISYYFAILTLSEVMSKEAQEQWTVIRDASTYPRSLLKRSGPPLFKSSMSLRPDFKSHPLIEKFQGLIRVNHDEIGKLADLYEDYITQVTDDVAKLPKGIQILELLIERFAGLPEVTAIQNAWNIINKHAPALRAQAKMFEGLVSSIDKLFTQPD